MKDDSPVLWALLFAASAVIFLGLRHVPIPFIIFAVLVFWWFGRNDGVRFIVRRRRRTFIYWPNIAFALGLAYLASWLDRLGSALLSLLLRAVDTPGVIA